MEPIVNRLDGFDSWNIHKTVLPQHTDHAGVMWHGSYVSWLEEARIEALLKVGLSYSDLSEHGYEMPVISMEITYHKSLYHGELVKLQSWVLPREGVRWPWITKFISNNGSLAAKAKVSLALVRNDRGVNKVIRKVPDQFSQALENLINVSVL